MDGLTRVCVVGGGFLGSAIAGELARSNCLVSLYDRDMKTQNVKQSVALQLEEYKKYGLSEGDIQAAIDRITFYCHLEDAVRDVDFVFEAIVEDLEIKKQVFCTLDNLTKSTTVLTSNTIGLDIEEIASLAKLSGRIMGVRFLHPVYFIPIVEITVPRYVLLETETRITQFFSSIGKKPFKWEKGQEKIRLNQLTTEAYQDMVFQKIPMDKIPLPKPTSKPHQITQPIKQNIFSSSHHSVHGSHGHYANHGGYHRLDHDMELGDERDESDDSCIVCMTNVKEMIVLPCGHQCLCKECSSSLQKLNAVCPVCRGKIDNIIKVFKV